MGLKSWSDIIIAPLINLASDQILVALEHIKTSKTCPPTSYLSFAIRVRSQPLDVSETLNIIEDLNIWRTRFIELAEMVGRSPANADVPGGTYPTLLTDHAKRNNMGLFAELTNNTLEIVNKSFANYSLKVLADV
ncbi:hypothetical protein TWF281_006316 [Arthrobotrys megalospora]